MFKQSAKCNLERVNKRPLTLLHSRYLFLFILECAIDFLLLPLLMYANGTSKEVTLHFFLPAPAAASPASPASPAAAAAHLLISLVLMRTSGG